MTAHYQSSPPPSPDPDLSREQVLDIYKQIGDQELRRHVPILQTDGKGYIAFLCCGQGMSHDRWWIHVTNALKRASKR